MDHSRLLHAYLSRLTSADIENIFKHDRECLQHQLNGNNSAQLQAQASFYASVCQAVGNIGKYDKELIKTIVEDCVK